VFHDGADISILGNDESQRLFIFTAVPHHCTVTGSVLAVSDDSLRSRTCRFVTCDVDIGQINVRCSFDTKAVYPEALVEKNKSVYAGKRRNEADAAQQFLR
jgi:hypothetical protein